MRTVAFVFLGLCISFGLSATDSIKYLKGVTDCGIVLAPDDSTGIYYKYDGGGAREAIINKVGERYYMFYDGAGKAAPYLWRACMATSTDLKNWTKTGPVLTPSVEEHPEANSSVFKDFMGTCSPWVYYEADSRIWHIYYLGNDATASDGTPYFAYNTCYASAKSITGQWIKKNDEEGKSDFVPFRVRQNSFYSVTASPGHVIQNPKWKGYGDKVNKRYMQYISVTGNADGVIRRSIAIARTNDLAAGDSFYAPSDENFWRIDDEPIVPNTEDIENSSIYYEPENGYWYLFTNHVYANSYTNAVWVYWTKDPDKWRVEDKAIVLDKSNCTWAKGAIGMPTVVKADDNVLVMVYDGVEGDGTGHLNRKIGLATIKLPLSPNTFVRNDHIVYLQCQTK